MATNSTTGQLFRAISTGWDAVRQWVLNTEQSLVGIITAIGGTIPAIDMCALIGAVLCLLVWLKSAMVKLEAFTLKLLSALQGFSLRVKQCCLNIRSYAKLHFSPTGLKIALGLNIGFAIRTFPQKTGIRRHPKRMRHRARRRRRR